MIKKIIITVCLFAVLGVSGAYDSTYSRKAIITEVKDDIVYCTDTQGNIWGYQGSGTIGHKIVLTMNDNHTTDNKDDIIIRVRG